jgi:sugar lactone lactonase YvrE
METLYGEETVDRSSLELLIEAEDLNQPQGLCYDPNGNIYIVDTYNNTINIVSDQGIIRYAGLNQEKDIYGFYEGGFVDGSLDMAMFNKPSDIVSDINGVLYITDSNNNAIRKIENGIVTTIAGDGTSGYVNALSSEARFNTPRGITVDDKGILYIADTLNHVIRTIDKEGNVETLTLRSKEDGDTSHILNEPSDLCFDSEGILYVLDSGNQLVKKVTNGYVEIVAGLVANIGTDGYVDGDYIDGNVAQARFAFPKSIVAYEGNVYIADTWNHTIRMIKKDQEIITIAGNGEPGFESDINASSLNGPSGLMVYKGKLYITDRWNDSLKSISLDYGAPVFDLNLNMPKLAVSDEIKVFVDNKAIVYNDVKPFLIDDLVYYPVREISESLGAKVSYDNASKMVTINYKNKQYTYGIQDDDILIRDSRTFMTIRKMATHLGFFVTIDDETNDVLITETK